MSDPFDLLRDGDTGATASNVATIKERARRIERRRQVGLGSAAVAIVAVAVAGIVVSTGPTRNTTRQLAQEARTSAEPSEAETKSEAAAKAERLQQIERRPGGAASRGAAPSSVTGGASRAAAPYAADTAESTLEATLEVNDKSLGPRRGAGLTLKVCNRGTSTVERQFNSGQRYDFEVSRNGSLVWRWSDGKAFAAAIGYERWGPGECKTWTEWWDGTDAQGRPAASGAYEAVGILSSSPPQRTAPRSFCLDLC